MYKRPLVVTSNTGSLENDDLYSNINALTKRITEAQEKLSRTGMGANSVVDLICDTTFCMSTYIQKAGLKQDYHVLIERFSNDFRNKWKERNIDVTTANGFEIITRDLVCGPSANDERYGIDRTNCNHQQIMLLAYALKFFLLRVTPQLANFRKLKVNGSCKGEANSSCQTSMVNNQLVKLPSY